MHVLGIGYSPAYRPRTPTASVSTGRASPSSKELLLASAELGRKVADLLIPKPTSTVSPPVIRRR